MRDRSLAVLTARAEALAELRAGLRADVERYPELRGRLTDDSALAVVEQLTADAPDTVSTVTTTEEFKS